MRHSFILEAFNRDEKFHNDNKYFAIYLHRDINRSVFYLCGRKKK